MRPSPWTIVRVAVALPALSLLPLVAQTTSIDDNEVVTNNLLVSTVKGSEIDGVLDFVTLEGIGVNGSDIRFRLGDGNAPLTGPNDAPLRGGDFTVLAGSGAPEAFGADGGRGGDIRISAGNGGADGGVGKTGDGGGIFLTAGAAGADDDLGGGQGDQGIIVLSGGGGELIVSSLGVSISEMLVLPTRSDSPTCNAAARGSTFVRVRAPSDPDAVCVCLDNGSATYGWVDLTGGSGCP